MAIRQQFRLGIKLTTLEDSQLHHSPIHLPIVEEGKAFS